MKPIKGMRTFSGWLLRIAVIVMIIHLYFNSFTTLNFKSWPFYLACIMLLMAALLLVGGLLSKQGLTVFAGLVIFVFSVYKLFISFNGVIDAYLVYQLVTLSIGFHFLSYGNDH